MITYLHDILDDIIISVIFIEMEEIYIENAKWFRFQSLQICYRRNKYPLENQWQTQIVACLRRYRNSPFVI